MEDGSDQQIQVLRHTAPCVTLRQCEAHACMTVACLNYNTLHCVTATLRH